MSKKDISADAAFLENQRKRLTAMRDQLVGEIAAATARERMPKTEEAREIEDDAQHISQSDVDTALNAVEAQRLHTIERALAKIDEGTYGLSDLSGDPIPKARLEAIPEAALTIQEEEAREKARQR